LQQPSICRSDPGRWKGSYNSTRNYTGIVKKLIKEWLKMTVYLDQFYITSLNPMLITPLFLHNINSSDTVVLTTLHYLFKKPGGEQHSSLTKKGIILFILLKLYLSLCLLFLYLHIDFKELISTVE
jgi:hypothetical protein